MAQSDDQTDPRAPMPSLEPDRVIVSTFGIEVLDTPGGARMLGIHLANRNELILLELNDDAKSEALADEIRPSRIEVPSGNGKIVIP